jgi:hypothetical protein
MEGLGLSVPPKRVTELDTSNLFRENAEVAAGTWLGAEGKPDKTRPVDLGDAPRFSDDPPKALLILARQSAAARLD